MLNIAKPSYLYLNTVDAIFCVLVQRMLFSHVDKRQGVRDVMVDHKGPADAYTITKWEAVSIVVVVVVAAAVLAAVAVIVVVVLFCRFT